VTHHCFEPKPLSQHYPRGERSLIGPFTRWNPLQTVEWFSHHGVELHTEADGRMFPITNDSQTIIDCLIRAATEAGIEIITSEAATRIEKHANNHYCVHTSNDRELSAPNILLATGGTRLNAGAKLAAQLGHELAPPVPSLFTFNITDSRFNGLSGISVPNAEITIPGSKLRSSGPLLITHWGLSGPGILKLSAWGARTLAEKNYQFQLCINWIPQQNPQQVFDTLRKEGGKRQIGSRSPFATLPKRLWLSFLKAASIDESTLWSQLAKKNTEKLIYQLTASKFHVDGKSLNKDEFVTCGGVLLKQINLKTMESKLHAGLYFAGEVMDIDGITGGFNFQNAWTTGHHAGTSIATNLQTSYESAKIHRK